MKKRRGKKLFLAIALGVFLSNSQIMGVKADNKAVIVDDNQDSKGPKVEEVTLSETYYDEYEIYSEGIAGKFFFYTNTPNNGITNQTVSIDIPANIYYTVQKDGVDIAYASKQTLSKMGTYVFQMTVVKNPEAPVSEQTVYKATYNFRIQPKPYKQENNSEYKQEEDDIEEIYSEFQEVFETEKIQEPESIEIPIEETQTQEMQTVTYEKNKYDINTGNYIQYFEDGYYLECSAVNGIITNESVYINLDGMGAHSEEVVVKKDSEECALPSDGLLSDSGKYELEIHIKENVYKYFFEIVAGASSLLTEYQVPPQVSLLEVLYQYEQQNLDRYKSAAGLYTVTFEQEGLYNLVMMDEFQNVIETEIEIDRTAPEVTLNKTENGVKIIYNQDDVKRIILQQGDKQEEITAISEIDKPGTYTLYLYDEAGNVEPVKFTIKKNINVATIVFILMVIALIAGAVIYYKKVKTNVNVK